MFSFLNSSATNKEALYGPLFPVNLISLDVQAALPENYVIRPLQVDDYEKGYYECLAQLTVAGNVTKQAFMETFEQLLRQGSYFSLVIEDTASKRIVGAGTIFLEQKFLRNCGKCGHIEDIVVHDSQRGKKLGLRIIDALKFIGIKIGCYKITLNCSEANVPFYEKCGLKLKDFQMTLYPAENQASTVSSKSQL